MARRRDPFGGDDVTRRAMPRQRSIVSEAPSLGEGTLRRRAPVSMAATAARTVSAPAEGPRRRTLDEVPAFARQPAEAVPSSLGIERPTTGLERIAAPRRRFQPIGEARLEPREAPMDEFPARRVSETPRAAGPEPEAPPAEEQPTGGAGFTPSGDPVADLRSLQQGTPNNENFLRMMDALKAAYPGRVSDVGASARGVWDKIVIDGVTYDVIQSATGDSGRWMVMAEGSSGGVGDLASLFGGGGGGFGGGGGGGALQPAVMGILQRFPHNPAGLQAAAGELQSMGIQILDPDSGRIQLPDGSVIDVLLATDQAWQWLPSEGSGGLPSGLIPGGAGPFQGPVVQSETDPLSQAVNQAFLALASNLTGQGSFGGLAGAGGMDLTNLLMNIIGGATRGQQ